MGEPTVRSPVYRRDILICCLLVCSALLTIATFSFAMYTVKEFSDLRARVSELEETVGNLHLLARTSIQHQAKETTFSKIARKKITRRTINSGLLPPPPNIASIKKVPNKHNAINITWTPVTTAKRFLLEVKAKGEGAWIQIYISKFKLSYVIQNVAFTKTYQFKMSSVNNAGRGPTSVIYEFEPGSKGEDTKKEKKKHKRVISIHLTGDAITAIVRDQNKCIGWKLQHKIGPVTYNEQTGHVVINVPGIYSIYSLIISKTNRPYFSHSMHINGKKALDRVIANNGKSSWHSSYHGAAFPLKKGDKVNVVANGGSTGIRGYFGAVLLSRVKGL